MNYILIVTEDSDVEARMRFGLPQYGVGVAVVRTLSDASRELRTLWPTAIVIDLPWDGTWSASMAYWLVRNIRNRGIRVALSSRTPLARNLKTAYPVQEAVFLPPRFNPVDVAEVWQETPAPAVA